MKKAIAFILALMLALGCMPAFAAVDNSGFVEADEMICITAEDTTGTGVSGNLYFTDLTEYFNMLLASEAAVSADAPWNMYISESNPNIVRWSNSAGHIIEMDTSVENPWMTLSYTAPGSNTIIYDSLNFTATELSPTGIRQLNLDELDIWVSSIFTDGANGKMMFGVLVSSTEGMTAPTESEAEEHAVEPEEAPFKDMVLVDKDGIRIYFTGEYTRYQNAAGIEIVIENNTDRELSITYFGSMNGWEMQPCTFNNLRPKSKTKEDITSIDITDGSEIESLDLAFEVIDWHRGTNQERETLFTYETGLIDLRAGTIENPPTAEAPAVEYSIGDTVSTDMMEFTLTGFDFVYHLDPGGYTEKDSIKGGSLGPGKDMVFANPEYTVKNVAKTTVAPSTDILFTVVYDDGYEFGMGTGEVCYIVDAPYIGGKYTSGSRVVLKLSPLASETYEAYIPASELIDTDKSAPLKVIVSIESSTGVEEFVYRIR